MPRSAAFQSLARSLRIASFCDSHGLATSEGLERVAALEAADRGASRREVLAGAAKLGVVGAVGAVAGPLGWALAAPRRPSDVAIIGAGLAGLACGDELYHFFGQRHSEPEVVDELRAFVDAMRDDLRTVGNP